MQLLRKVGDGQDDTRARARKVISLTIGNGVLTGTSYCPFITGVLTAENAKIVLVQSILAAGAIVNIILILYNGRQLNYQASATEVSKLYSNTLMVTLNSRIHLSSGDSRGTQNVAMSTLKFETIPVESQDAEEEEEEVNVYNKTVSSNLGASIEDDSKVQ